MVREVGYGCDRFRAVDPGVFAEAVGFSGAEWVDVMLSPFLFVERLAHTTRKSAC